MTKKATLLVKIEHPNFTKPLNLMCGQGFEVLRTDVTGNDVHGLNHQGQEYLLFPMDFQTEPEGRLSVRVPVALDDNILADKQADGAKVMFFSPHGVPFFAGMPEEYQSNTGTLRVLDNGGVVVDMDKLDPDSAAPWPDALDEEYRAQEAHNHCHHEGCDCGGNDRLSDDKVFLDVFIKDLPDAKLAEHIRKIAGELNSMLSIAMRTGLKVEIGFEESGGEHLAPKVVVGSIMRPL